MKSVQVPKHSERPLPSQTYCAFEFATTVDNLTSQFQSEPLEVEVYTTDTVSFGLDLTYSHAIQPVCER